MLKRLKGYGWPIFALITIGLFSLACRFPDATEKWYAGKIYPFVRSWLEPLLNWLPFSGYYLFVFVIFIAPLDIFRPLFAKTVALKTRFFTSFRRLLTAISVLIALFYWFWGFNYARQPIEDKLQLQTEALSPTLLRQTLDSLLPQITAARTELGLGAINTSAAAAINATQARELLNQTLQELGYAPVRKPHLVRTRPTGALLRLGASGVYLPWIGQAHVDNALTSAQTPAVSLHELAHAAGLADEAACDFVSFLACQKSTDALVRYSGLLGQWRLAAGRYKQYEPQAYAALRLDLSADIRQDLDDINQVFQKYPSFFGAAPYNQFLKWQGETEGSERYASALGLLRAYQKKTKTTQ